MSDVQITKEWLLNNEWHTVARDEEHMGEMQERLFSIDVKWIDGDDEVTLLDETGLTFELGDEGFSSYTLKKSALGQDITEQLDKLMQQQKEATMGDDDTQQEDTRTAFEKALAPFVRGVTRDGVILIYLGSNTIQDACPHWFASSSFEMSYTPTGFWVDEDESSANDIIELYAAPEKPWHNLNREHRGSLLWKREEKDATLEALELALQQAQAALDAYKEGKK